MSEKSSLVARRAWKILRLALIWTRKGGIFRNRAAISLSAFAKIIRKQLIHSSEQRGALVYGDREFSFDDTPMVHVKMHRPSSLRRFKMPCIVKPEVDFDYDHDDIMICVDDDDVDVDEEEYFDETIDVKAEVFIAKFYEQMKMQTQISCSNHDGVLFRRGSS